MQLRVETLPLRSLNGKKLLFDLFPKLARVFRKCLPLGKHPAALPEPAIFACPEKLSTNGGSAAGKRAGEASRKHRKRFMISTLRVGFLEGQTQIGWLR